MSGPKVICIVTKDEIEAICRSHLARVDAAIDALVCTLKRYGKPTEEKRKELEQRRRLLQQSLVDERYLDVQKIAPSLVDFCHAEIESAKQKAIAEAQTARGRRRRLVDAARSVIAALEANGRPVDRNLRAIVESALGANDVTLDAMQTSLEVAFRSMAVSAATDEPSERAKALAGRLATGENPQSLEQWLTRNPIKTGDRDQRLDKALAELEVLSNAASLERYSKRAAAIAAELSTDRRALLTDSLILDATSEVRRAREIAATRGRFETLDFLTA